ncbi:MAG: glycosyltransferase, partial [Proteobacteria bacterium]|nr:glycosyltransferase [Pseudomonadota bacterium]
NVRERNFGVWKLWEEMEALYPNFHFLHGHGLGILAVGENVDAECLAFVSLDDVAKRRVSEFFSNLGNKFALTARLARLQDRLSDAEASIAERDAVTGELAAVREERERLTGELAAVREERERLTAELSLARAQLAQVYTSTSWRVSAPVRFLGRAVHGLATYVRWTPHRMSLEPVRDLVAEAEGFRSTGQVPAETMRRNIAAFSYKPLISILMPTYNVAPVFLAKAIESIREQAYPFWELCICDDGSTNVETVETLNGYAERDGRIKLLLSKENRGISAATNAALEIADGDFIAMLDHDDELTPDALYEVASALNEAPETDAVYTDSDKIDADGVLSEPFYKPDWSLELFRGIMYIGHLLVVRRALAKKAGGFDTRYAKVQDFELMLRVSEATDRIRHIPKILYHWRKISGSVAYGLDEKSDIGDLQVAAVNAHLERCGVAASACAHPTIGHRVVIKTKPRKTWPLVSIIIPSKDAPCHIGRCLQSIFTRTTYQDFEVIVVDNGTTDPQALAYLRQYSLKIVSYNEKFNFSRANNLGIAEARGEYVVLLNNDTEIVTPEWIEVMLFHMELPDVGAVGPLLL